MTDEERLNKLFEPDFPPYTDAPDSDEDTPDDFPNPLQTPEPIIDLENDYEFTSLEEQGLVLNEHGFPVDPMDLFDKITPRPPKQQGTSQDTEQTPYQRYQDLSKEERRRKYAERLGFAQEVRKQGAIEQLKNKFKKHQ